MSFRAPKAPPPPPPPTPLPVETQPDIRQKAQAEIEKSMNRKGRASTILSGQLGDTSQPTLAKKTLLGG